MAETTVRPFGQDLDLVHELIVTGRKVGADKAFYAALAHDEGLFLQAVQFVKSGGKIEEVAAHPAKAAEQLDLIDGLIEEGGYNKLDSWITGKNAPAYLRLDPEPEVKYLDLGYCESSAVAVQRMTEREYRPAEDPEVIRDLNKHPDLPVSGNPVVVLGSFWWHRHGFNGVLVFGCDGGERNVGLYWWDGAWSAGCRFAAVRVAA